MEICDAIACAIAIYVMHGLEYHKQLRNTLTFIECYLCELATSSKIPVPVLKLHNSLVMMNCDVVCVLMNCDAVCLFVGV